MDIDLELLAYDIADLLQRGEYGIDAGASDILAELPDFIARVTRNAENDGA